VLWAAKGAKSKHHFNYPLMRQIAGGKQMKSVWRIAVPRAEEKKFGKHPTQKPVALVERCILASTREGDLILDPFVGGGTTAVAALGTKRRCVGIDLEEANLKIASRRVDNAAHLFLSHKTKDDPCPDALARSPMATN
jgi:site-specific DNA-methyltransferase (adenine-specific)